MAGHGRKQLNCVGIVVCTLLCTMVLSRFDKSIGMPVQPDVVPVPRVPLPEAMSKIMEVLRKGRALSISELSRVTGVDRRTVGKALRMLESVQSILHSCTFEMTEVGRRKMFALSVKRVKAREAISSAKQRVVRGKH